jgi:hypothetical protein
LRNEHEFNAGLSAAFRKNKDLKSVKLSDKFKAGVPDLLVFSPTNVFLIESKFVAILPRRKTTPFLKHKLEPAQFNFMKTLPKGSSEYAISLIAVGFKEMSCFFIVPADSIIDLDAFNASTQFTFEDKACEGSNFPLSKMGFEKLAECLLDLEWCAKTKQVKNG